MVLDWRNLTKSHNVNFWVSQTDLHNNTALSPNHYSEQLSGEGLLLLFILSDYLHTYILLLQHTHKSQTTLLPISLPNFWVSAILSISDGFLSIPFSFYLLHWNFVYQTSVSRGFAYLFHVWVPQLHSKFLYLKLFTDFINVFFSFF